MVKLRGQKHRFDYFYTSSQTLIVNARRNIDFNARIKYCCNIFNLKVIFLNKKPEEAYQPLISGCSPPYLPFR